MGGGLNASTFFKHKIFRGVWRYGLGETKPLDTPVNCTKKYKKFISYIDSTNNDRVDRFNLLPHPLPSPIGDKDKKHPIRSKFNQIFQYVVYPYNVPL